MRFLSDNRAQSIQVGAVLLFGVLIILLATWQAFVVPDQNEEIEFNHNQELQQQMTELRTTVNSMPDAASTRSATLNLGVRYPSRTVFRNPAPSSGTVRTTGGDSSFNFTINAQATEETENLNKLWDTGVEYESRALEYRPEYNLYAEAPQTIFEHSILYNKFDRQETDLTITDQTLISGNRITLVALDGSLSKSRVDSESIDFEPLSTQTREVRIEPDGDQNITLELSTHLSKQRWQEQLDKLARNHSLSYTSNTDRPNRVNISLEQRDDPYRLRLAKVGVGTGATETAEAYLTDEPNDVSEVTEGKQETLAVEVRDKYNKPMEDIEVNATATEGDLEQDSVTSNEDGQAKFQYTAPDGTVDSDVIDFSLDDSTNYDSDSPRDVRIDINIEEEPSTGGGGSGPYNISFNETAVDKEDGMTCDPDCVYDLADDPDGEFNLTAETEPSVVGANVDFALNTTDRGDFTDDSDTETNSDGNATGVFDMTDTGGIRAYVTSGGGGDTIDINLTDSGSRPVFSAVSPDPDVLSDSDGEFVRVYFPTSTPTDGWTINDDDNQVTNLPSESLQGEVYFARAPVEFADEWSLDINDVYELDTQLSNNGDPLFFNNSNGDVIDQVAYNGSTTTNGWDLSLGPGDVGVRKKSDGAYIDTDSKSDWRVESEDDFFGEFTVSIDSYDDPVNETETIDVMATINNTGEVERTQTVELDVDNDQSETFDIDADSTSLTLGGNEEQQVTLSYTTQTGDSSEIEFSVVTEDNFENRTVTVNGPAFFDVNITGTNSPVTEGEDVTVSYEVTNTGDVSDTQNIVFAINGTTEATNSSVSLDSGQTSTGTFTYTTETGDSPAIEANVSSDDDFATETVTVNEPALFDVNITGTNSPVTEGETLTVDVNVTNTGDLQGTQTLNLTDAGFNNMERDTVEVTLNGGEFNNSITLAWETSDGDAGTGDVTVFSENTSDSQEVTVNEPPQFDTLEATSNKAEGGVTEVTFTYTVTNPPSSDEVVFTVTDDRGDSNSNTGPASTQSETVTVDNFRSGPGDNTPLTVEADITDGPCLTYTGMGTDEEVTIEQFESCN